MPVYEYECSSCGGRFEVTQKFSDPQIEACKLCNATSIRKILSPTAFVLKGSGWYASDYPSQDNKKASEADKPAPEAKTTTEAKPASCPAGGCGSGGCGSKGS